MVRKWTVGGDYKTLMTLLVREAEALVAQCRLAGLHLVTVESCTGGLLAASITEIPGASEIFEEGFVVYSNAAKKKLGVPAGVLEDAGAVSRLCARALCVAALERTPTAHLSLAITGIAGPGGGTKEKPVGLVYGATAVRGGDCLCKKWFLGNFKTRSAIRLESGRRLLEMATTVVQNYDDP